MRRITQLLHWAQKNERHLGALLFVFGFVTDLFTFSFLPVSLVNYAFLGYLAIGAVSVLGAHLFSGAHEHPSTWRRTLAIVFPLLAQYAIGSLLSGFLIFYTKSAAVFVSWPFLLLLVAAFIGNEYFRTYYKYLAFQVLLLFFSLYAYVIFAVPLAAHTLGPVIFLLSTAIAILLFALYLRLLWRLHRAGFAASVRVIVPGALAIVVALNLCYFTGLIPPIPLTLPTAGIYHGLSHRSDGYVVEAEQSQAWWNPFPQTIHHVAGTPLIGFTSVFAPYKFGTYVTHVWEWYDPSKHEWLARNQVTFLIAGGRDGGYRGYSEVFDPAPGKWRLTVETTNKQVIGRVNFNVVTVATSPLLVEEKK